METLRLRVVNLTQICDGERIKGSLLRSISLLQTTATVSPSHGSTLVRNYLLQRGRVSPDKILRGLTPLSFGFDLQGLLTEGGREGWRTRGETSLPYTPPALDLPPTNNKHMDPHCQLGITLSERCTALT